MIKSNEKSKLINADVVIVGAGITGAILAERFSSHGYSVAVIEKRNYIGGNCFDYKDDSGIIVQKCGPHIFHTKYVEVWKYLSKFTDWIPYEHKVKAFVDGMYIPIPFNFNTIEQVFSKVKAKEIFKILINEYGTDARISILTLLECKQNTLMELGKYVYDKIFKNYSIKQWGISPDEIDKTVLSRVPIVVGRDDRYFSDKYQGMPKYGFTELIRKMLLKPNIRVYMNRTYRPSQQMIKCRTLFYTGPIDEYYGYSAGRLDYRRFRMNIKKVNKASYQPSAVVNYPNDYKYTRITEYKKLYSEKSRDTIIGQEYPGNKGYFGWPILTKKNIDCYKHYAYMNKEEERRGVVFVGRLAEYKYLNMDEAANNALRVFNAWRDNE